MSAKKKEDVLRQLNSKLGTSTTPKQELTVTGYGVPLISSHRKGYGTAETAPSAAPITADTSLHGDNLSQPHNPWQQPPSGKQKEKVVAVRADKRTSRRTARPEKTAGKGWTVILNTSVEHPNPVSQDHHAPQSTGPDPTPQSAVPPDSTPHTGLRRPTVSKNSHSSRSVSRGKSSQRQGRRKVRPKGRDSETRGDIQYLGRKYFLKWSNRVFGRVLPSVARQHFARHCKRKVLGAWRDEWWVEHKEWKLGIRAECHNRYRLWIIAWNSWSIYIHSCREKKKMVIVSQNHLSKMRLKQTWLCWKSYVEMRRDKHAERLLSAQWHLTAVKKRCWLQWKRALRVHLHIQTTDAMASQHWTLCLQRKVWAQWTGHYEARLVQSGQLAIAARHWELRLKRPVVRAWCDYVKLRRRKLYLKRVAIGARNSTLLLTSYSHWKIQFLKNRKMAEFEDLIVHKSKLSILRRSLVQWRLFVSMRKHEVELMSLAQHHHCLVLQCKAMHAFKAHLSQRKQTAQHKLQALQFHVRTRMQQCWGEWLRRCENNEEIALGGLSRQARAVYGGKLSQTVLGAWVRYVIHQRHRKKLKSLADTYFRECALPKYFEAFRANVSVSKYKQVLKEQSESYRREVLLSIGFYKWWRESQLSCDVRMLERVALLHWEGKAKHRLLQLWHLQYQQRLQHHQQEETAVTHSTLAVLRTTFSKWRYSWQCLTCAAGKCAHATSHHSFKLQAAVWRGWLQYVGKRREGHTHKKLAEAHYHAVILGKVLRSWQTYHHHTSVKTSKKHLALHQHHMWEQRHVIARWREAVMERRRGRKLFEMASVHYAHVCSMKHLSRWREVTTALREEREREDEEVCDITSRLLRFKSQRALRVWSRYAESAVAARFGKAKAASHYQQLLCHKVLLCWHKRCLTRRRKDLLNRKCAVFNQSRLTSQCYARWRRQFMCELQYKQKGVLSLWHWSHMLEHKVLTQWLQYTVEKRRKAQRYAAAMQRHRAWLLGLGVRQWIRVGTGRRAQRDEETLNMHAKNTRSVMCCVRRCAHHWRELARKHRPPAGLVHRPILHQHATPSIWADLAKNLDLPEDRTRPQPRRPSYLTAVGDSLPRLAPPPPPHSHMTGHPEGGNSLDVTSELTVMGSQVSVSPSGAGECHAPSSAPSIPREIKTCRTLSSSSSGEAWACHTSSSPPSSPREMCHAPCPADLPHSHPLKDKNVQDKIMLMRRRMREYLQLKVDQKALREELAQSRGGEQEKVKRRLEEVEVLIQQNQPVVREMATAIDNLLQLCS